MASLQNNARERLRAMANYCNTAGCLRGAGDAKYIATTAFISIAIIRPISAWVLCYPVGWGLVGAWISLFIDQCVRCILNGTRFRKGKWAQIEV